MIPYVLVVLASVATATVVIVADRVDPDGAALPPVTSVTTTPAITTVTTTAVAATSSSPTVSAEVTVTTTARRSTTALVPQALAGQDIERVPTSRPWVALTFDAGANADGVASILTTLRREGVPATFFLTGRFTEQFAGPSAAIAAGGHRLGNHSVSHPHFPALSDQTIRDELTGAAQSIRVATGRDPRPLFRFPFGDRDQRTIRVVNDAGYVAIRWTVDTLGWKGTSGGMTAAAVTNKVMNTLRPGQIVLMHVGSNPDDHTTLDADALPSTIAQVRAAGYQFVTLDALLT